MGEKKIKITKDGPYIVSGGVPLSEKRIKPKGLGYEWEDGRALPQGEQYALCRCGNTKTPPFCDGSHVRVHFDGTETASRVPFQSRASVTEGEGIDLLDDGRCAFARFCHRDKGSVWELTRGSGNPECRAEAILAANECPSGRLVAVGKDGEPIELPLTPAIEVIQDPDRDVSGGLYVKGGIPIEAADGHTYEVRNRAVLCRCGKSRNKPFCDAMHVAIDFRE